MVGGYIVFWYSYSVGVFEVIFLYIVGVVLFEVLVEIMIWDVIVDYIVLLVVFGGLLVKNIVVMFGGIIVYLDCDYVGWYWVCGGWLVLVSLLCDDIVVIVGLFDD